jgi:integrase/recombinase XerD
MEKHVKLYRKVHKGEARLLAEFAYDTELIRLIKTLPDATWSQQHKAWHLPDIPGRIAELLNLFKGIASVDYKGLKTTVATGSSITVLKQQEKSALPELHGAVKNKISVFESWLRSKRYSASTIKTYSDSLQTFLRYYSGKNIEEIGNDDLVKFNNDYILANSLSSSFQNQVVNAVKLFYKTAENRKIDIELIHRPRREHLLPNVLSKEEVAAILSAPVNIKHRAMLSLIYACGLRRSELLNLKPADVNSGRKLLIIRQGKGRKDRIVPLSEKVIAMLRAYYKAYRPVLWLFEGQKPGEQYTGGSLQEVLKQSLEKAKITKPVTLHWLRHSYATHLLESGTDLRYIQELLGHKSSKTTEIYTHVSQKSIEQIKTPFDDLEL